MQNTNFNLTANNVWNFFISKIEKDDSIPFHIFEIYFKNITPELSIDQNGAYFLILKFQNAQKKNRVFKEYKNIIEEIIYKEFPSITKIKFIYENDASLIIKKEEVKESENNVKESINYINVKESIMFDERYTFSSFVKGESNIASFSAAKTFAENFSDKNFIYNPLLITGASGLGKTHLLHAIGNYITSVNQKLNILYVTAEEFFHDYIISIQDAKEGNYNFRNKYFNVDIFMVDDLQFIKGKTGCEESLFNIFNNLILKKKKVVFCADRNPSDFCVDLRFTSRLNSGLSVQISKPDLQTKILILNSKAKLRGFDISQEVINYIAENDVNIRELEGYLNSIYFYSTLHELKSISISVAKEIIKNKNIQNSKKLSVNNIISKVCDYFNISQEELTGEKRNKKIVIPRHICIYLIKDLLKLTYTEIGAYFGGKSHTTIIYSLNAVENEIKNNNKNYINFINDIKDFFALNNN